MYLVRRKISIFLGALIGTASLLSAPLFSAEPPFVDFQYDQTRLLVDYVQKAADLFSRKGAAAFPEFSHRDGEWFHRERYIFIYDLEGNCVFHPVDRELIGDDLLGFRDLDGKPVIRYIVETVTKKDSPDGWVHYLWAEPGEIFPLWKSSYVTLVRDPSGKGYALGSGIYNMRLEKRFIVDTVTAAAELIEEKGRLAFREIQDESSRFVYQDVYVFVLTMDGKAVVDPAFPADEASQVSLEGRNLYDFQDAVGKYPVREMIVKLKKADSAWVMYMWPRTGEVRPSKKVAYIRKARLDGRTLIVGSDLFLAKPIWMK